MERGAIVRLLARLRLRVRMVLFRNVAVSVVALVLMSGPVLSGCVLLAYGWGPSAPTPEPTTPANPPPEMRRAIAAARSIADQYSKAAVALTSAWPVDLAEICRTADAPCQGLVGNGWAARFAITSPDGTAGSILVVVDATLGLVLTRQ
jgi:hypothetical protein